MNALSGDVFKWTLGALLIVNSGALLALLNSNDLRQDALNDAGLYFGFGLFLSLFTGFCWTWGAATGANDILRRAWDATPLNGDEFEAVKPRKVTLWFIAVGLIAFMCSFATFVMGCAAMAFVPNEISMAKASEEYSEAVTRYAAAVSAYVELVKNPAATSDQIQMARDRVNALKVEADIAERRDERTLGLNVSESENAVPAAQK